MYTISMQIQCISIHPRIRFKEYLSTLKQLLYSFGIKSLFYQNLKFFLMHLANQKMPRTHALADQ